MTSTRPHRPALYVKRRLAVAAILIGIVLTVVCVIMGLFNGLMLLGIATVYLGVLAVLVLSGRRI